MSTGTLGAPGPPPGPCFPVFVFSRPPASSDDPQGPALTERSKTLRPAATQWMLFARLNEAEDEAEGGPICMKCSSYDECDGHGLLLSDLLALPAAASARTSTCSVLNVKTVVTASINTRPQDGCWSPAHAFQMVAAAVAYLLRSVDVGAQAPTQLAVKMAARPSCAAR